MSSLVLDLLVIVASVLLAASAVIALYRIVRGPSILDRMIATDVVLASIMCGLGGFMALSGRTDLLPVLIVLAMLGFVGSVSVSRYVSKSDSMTPGEEVGSLSDFSNSDWHMPKDSDESGAKSQSEDEGEGPDDVARGISDVSDGPDAITVRDEGVRDEAVPNDGDPNGSDPDVEGEGLGTGPDPGPDDADDGARTVPDSDQDERTDGGRR